MLSAASENLQINFRPSLWSSMLTNVTMQPVIAAAAKTTSAIFKTRRRTLHDIKKFEALRSLPWDSCTGSSRHAGSGVRINSQGSVEGRWPRRDMAPADHGPRLSDGPGAKDLPGPVCLRQRGYANRDDRRPAPLVKHSQPGSLAAHGRPHLQRGVRGLHF